MSVDCCGVDGTDGRVVVGGVGSAVLLQDLRDIGSESGLGEWLSGS